jgi:hypothetical protein
MAGTVLLHQRSFAGEFVEPAFAELAELVQAHGLDPRTGASQQEDMSCRQVCSTPERRNDCASDAFHQVSSDMTLNLALETDGAARLVTFRDGTLTFIKSFVTVTEPVDVTIRGDATFWRNLLSPVPPAVSEPVCGVRAETCQVSGNAELYWAYFAALTRLFDVMRDVGNNR